MDTHHHTPPPPNSWTPPHTPPHHMGGAGVTELCGVGGVTSPQRWGAATPKGEGRGVPRKLVSYGRSPSSLPSILRSSSPLLGSPKMSKEAVPLSQYIAVVSSTCSSPPVGSRASPSASLMTSSSGQMASSASLMAPSASPLASLASSPALSASPMASSASPVASSASPVASSASPVASSASLMVSTANEAGSVNDGSSQPASEMAGSPGPRPATSVRVWLSSGSSSAGTVRNPSGSALVLPSGFDVTKLYPELSKLGVVKPAPVPTTEGETLQSSKGVSNLVNLIKIGGGASPVRRVGGGSLVLSGSDVRQARLLPDGRIVSIRAADGDRLPTTTKGMTASVAGALGAAAPGTSTVMPSASETLLSTSIALPAASAPPTSATAAKPDPSAEETAATRKPGAAASGRAAAAVSAAASCSSVQEAELQARSKQLQLQKQLQQIHGGLSRAGTAAHPVATVKQFRLSPKQVASLLSQATLSPTSLTVVSRSSILPPQGASAPPPSGGVKRKGSPAANARSAKALKGSNSSFLSTNLASSVSTSTYSSCRAPEGGPAPPQAGVFSPGLAKPNHLQAKISSNLQAKASSNQQAKASNSLQGKASNNLQAKPSTLTAKPNNLQAKPNNLQTKPNNLPAKPNNLPAKPNNLPAKTSNAVEGKTSCPTQAKISSILKTTDPTPPAGGQPRRVSFKPDGSHVASRELSGGPSSLGLSPSSASGPSRAGASVSGPSRVGTPALDSSHVGSGSSLAASSDFDSSPAGTCKDRLGRARDSKVAKGRWRGLRVLPAGGEALPGASLMSQRLPPPLQGLHDLLLGSLACEAPAVVPHSLLDLEEDAFDTPKLALEGRPSSGGVKVAQLRVSPLCPPWGGRPTDALLEARACYRTPGGGEADHSLRVARAVLSRARARHSQTVAHVRALIRATRHSHSLAAATVTHFRPQHLPHQEGRGPRRRRRPSAPHSCLLERTTCVYETWCPPSGGGAAPQGMCGAPALPGTRHCVRHITYNVDQQIFVQCCARAQHGGTMCRVPVLCLGDVPLCAAHKNFVADDTTSGSSSSPPTTSPPSGGGPAPRRVRRRGKCPPVYGKRKRRRSTTPHPTSKPHLGGGKGGGKGGGGKVVPSTAVRPPMNNGLVLPSGGAFPHLLPSSPPHSPFSGAACADCGGDAPCRCPATGGDPDDLDASLELPTNVVAAASRLLDPQHLHDLLLEEEGVLGPADVKPEPAAGGPAPDSPLGPQQLQQCAADAGLTAAALESYISVMDNPIDSMISSSFNQQELNVISQYLGNIVDQDVLLMQNPSSGPPMDAITGDPSPSLPFFDSSIVGDVGNSVPHSGSWGSPQSVPVSVAYSLHSEVSTSSPHKVALEAGVTLPQNDPKNPPVNRPHVQSAPQEATVKQFTASKPDAPPKQRLSPSPEGLEHHSGSLSQLPSPSMPPTPSDDDVTSVIEFPSDPSLTDIDMPDITRASDVIELPKKHVPNGHALPPSLGLLESAPQGLM